MPLSILCLIGLDVWFGAVPVFCNFLRLEVFDYETGFVLRTNLRKHAVDTGKQFYKYSTADTAVNKENIFCVSETKLICCLQKNCITVWLLALSIKLQK